MEKPKIIRGVLILEGKIETGDYVTIRRFVSYEANFNKMNGQVFLASAGGNVFEALEIGYLIRHLQLSTDAPSQPPLAARASGGEIIHPSDLNNPKNYQCTSACFLLYVAGIYREFIWAGRLGLHRPRIDYRPVGITGTELTAAELDMRGKIGSFLKDMNVPPKYLQLMYATPDSAIRWITQKEFNTDLRGYSPDTQALLDRKCDPNLPTERRNQCIEQVKMAIRVEAYRRLRAPPTRDP